jgi:hypothetical protein
MATGEQPRDLHAEEAPPDEEDELEPGEARVRGRMPPEERADEEPPPENGAHEAHEGEPSRQRGRLEGFIPDIVKRTFYAGLGAVFTTEEGIRKIASDLKLPKDVANYLIQQAAASKDELFRVVGKELRGFLETVNISGELQKLLTSLSFEIKTEIRFIPNDEAIAGVRPDVKVGRMSFRRNKDRDRDDKKPGDKDEG